MMNKFYVTFSGPTGTGKSKIVNQKILNELSRDEWDPIALTFSAQTTAAGVQSTIQSKLSE